jgi:DNA-binding transcriptional LysR family regulator
VELRHLRYFIAVAEERHFSRAAERLFMSQPPLSQQIQQLEREIGVPLLARTSRRVELTPAGESFLADARDILARADRAAERARRAARGEEGWLAIGFVGSATYDLLPEILRAFRAQYPDVALDLHELLGGEQASALRERRIHVGFARVPTPEEGIRQETIVREPLNAALPAAHRCALAPEVTLSDLAGEPFILYPRLLESSYAQHLLELCRAAGFEAHVVQETGELHTAISLVAAGIGVSLVPASVRTVGRSGVVYRPLAAPSPTVELTVGYRADDASPVLPRFLRIVRGIAAERSGMLRNAADGTAAADDSNQSRTAIL